MQTLTGESIGNRRKIFDFLLNKKNATKKAMMQEINISMPTLMRNLSELTDMHLIVETGQDDSSGGRRPSTYSIRTTAKIAIGLDITRNHIAVIAVDLGINILSHSRIRMPFVNSDEYFAKVADYINQFIDEHGYGKEAILGVGISLPGILSQHRDKLLYGDVIDFNNGDIERFIEKIGYPCYASNDSTAAGVAEFSAHSDLKNAVYLYLSNSVGGSMLINGNVYEGEHNKSSEFGHVCLVPNGRKCYCGLSGCFNAYCNATILSENFDGSVETFFAKLREGDSHCRSVWNEYKKYLVQMIKTLRIIFDAEIILGGYVGSCMGEYIEEVREMCIEGELFERNVDYIRPCQYKIEAAALGAALYYITKFTNEI